MQVLYDTRVWVTFQKSLVQREGYVRMGQSSMETSKWTEHDVCLRCPHGTEDSWHPKNSSSHQHHSNLRASRYNRANSTSWCLLHWLFKAAIKWHTDDHIHDNLNKYIQGYVPASERRILFMKWVGRAWEDISSNHDKVKIHQCVWEAITLLSVNALTSMVAQNVWLPSASGLPAYVISDSASYTSH